MKPAGFQESDVRQFFQSLQRGNDEAVVELRALGFEGRDNNTFSGYFNQEEQFVQAARLAAQKCSGAYCTINVCNPQLLSRRANRAVRSFDDAIRGRAERRREEVGGTEDEA